jgi:uncharacterized DUF497 family protein
VTTWDEDKRLRNFASHGVDFRDLDAVEWERALVFEDRRRDYGETRLIAMAPPVAFARGRVRRAGWRAPHHFRP